MSELTNTVHTVGYSQKFNAEERGFGKKYENLEVQFYVQIPTEPDTGYAEIEQALRGTFRRLHQLAEEEVANVAGVRQATSDTNNAQEAVEDAERAIKDRFPGAEEVAAPPSQAQSMTPREFVQHVVGLDRSGKKAALADRLESHPDEFWDNRSQKESGERPAKFPDFRYGKGDATDVVKELDVNLPLWID